jgi:hypothetical protein
MDTAVDGSTSFAHGLRVCRDAAAAIATVVRAKRPCYGRRSDRDPHGQCGKKPTLAHASRETQASAACFGQLTKLVRPDWGAARPISDGDAHPHQRTQNIMLAAEGLGTAAAGGRARGLFRPPEGLTIASAFFMEHVKIGRYNRFNWLL